MEKLKQCLYQLGYFSHHIYQRIVNENYIYHAAQLTITTLLSLVPLAVVSFALLQVFPAFKELGYSVQSFIFNHFVASTGEVVQQYLSAFTEKASRLSLTGLLALFVFAVWTLVTIEQALNTIWRVPSRGFGLSTILRYWAILTLMPLLVGLSLFISSYVNSLTLWQTLVTDLGLTQAMLLTFFSFLLSTVAFTLLYSVVPNCKVYFRSAFLGGLIAAILFELAKRLFSLYIAMFPTYELIYGALATLPVFLLWVYLSWIITLIGGVIVHSHMMGYSHRIGKKLDSLTHALTWLGYLWRAHYQGYTLTLADLISLDKNNYEIAPEKQIQVLLNTGLISKTEKDSYFVACDYNQLMFKDVYQRLPWKFPLSEDSSFKINQLDTHFAKILQDLDELLKKKMSFPITDLYYDKK